MRAKVSARPRRPRCCGEPCRSQRGEPAVTSYGQMRTRRQAGLFLFACAFFSPLVGCFAFRWDQVQRDGGTESGDSAMPMDASVDDAGEADAGTSDGDQLHDGGRDDSDAGDGATTDLDGSRVDAGSLDAATDGRAFDADAPDASSSDASSFDASDGSGDAGLSSDSGLLIDAAIEAGTVLPCVGVDCDLACPDDDPSCYAICTGSKKCKLKCGKGARCELTCASGEDCASDCGPKALCDVHCSDAKKCKVHCASGSDCAIDCSTSDCTKADCDDGASCLLECRTGSTCDFGKCSAPSLCPGNVAVCNRLCPPSSI